MESTLDPVAATLATAAAGFAISVYFFKGQPAENVLRGLNASFANTGYLGIAVVCAALPLGATAFVLAQRYKLLEAETSTGAVVSTAASVITVSIVMAALAYY